jgi:hypothetical protein
MNNNREIELADAIINIELERRRQRSSDSAEDAKAG